MKKIKVKSAAPIYLAGLTWLILSFFLAFYNYSHLAAAVLASACVYILSSLIIPKKEVTVKIPHKTGNPDFDAILSKTDGFLSRLEILRADTGNAKISNHITAIIAVTREMIEITSRDVQLIKKLKSFSGYYFPVLIQFAETYETLSASSGGDSVKGALLKTEAAIGTLEKAFKNKLDNMYSDKVLDISAEIKALKTIIASEGLD